MFWRQTFLRWRMLFALHGWREIVAIAVAAAIVLVVLGIPIALPNIPGWSTASDKANWNFEPDWVCETVPAGRANPICFKKRPTAKAPTAPTVERQD